MSSITALSSFSGFRDRPGPSPAQLLKRNRWFALATRGTVLAAAIAHRPLAELAAVVAIGVAIGVLVTWWDRQRTTRLFDEREISTSREGLFFGHVLFVAGVFAWSLVTLAVGGDMRAPTGVLVGAAVAIKVGQVVVRRRMG